MKTQSKKFKDISKIYLKRGKTTRSNSRESKFWTRTDFSVKSKSKRLRNRSLIKQPKQIKNDQNSQQQCRLKSIKKWLNCEKIEERQGYLNKEQRNIKQIKQIIVVLQSQNNGIVFNKQKQSSGKLYKIKNKKAGLTSFSTFNTDAPHFKSVQFSVGRRYKCKTANVYNQTVSHFCQHEDLNHKPNNKPRKSQNLINKTKMYETAKQKKLTKSQLVENCQLISKQSSNVKSCKINTSAY